MTTNPADTADKPDLLATFIGREIDMFEDKHVVMMGGGPKTVVEIVPVTPDPPLFQQIRAAAAAQGYNARIILPKKVPGDNPDPKGIDIYVVLDVEAKWRISLGRNGLFAAPKEEPLIAGINTDFTTAMTNGLRKPAAVLKPVRFKPRMP
ncbi:MAG: hypothetical protein PW788_02880 [Micavibrio sp.]|nr:hypothetical protein [Micavibrio sp.]